MSHMRTTIGLHVLFNFLVPLYCLLSDRASPETSNSGLGFRVQGLGFRGLKSPNPKPNDTKKVEGPAEHHLQHVQCPEKEASTGKVWHMDPTVF